MAESRRAEALSQAVALLTARAAGIVAPAPRVELDDAGLLDAVLTIGQWQAEHAVGGRLVVEVVGAVAAFLAAEDPR